MINMNMNFCYKFGYKTTKISSFTDSESRGFSLDLGLSIFQHLSREKEMYASHKERGDGHRYPGPP